MVPRHRSLPFTMMATRSQSASTSSMRCEVSTTERLSMVWRMRFQRLRRDTGSRPADGSSSSTHSGSPTIAMATQSLRFMPPERRSASLLACGRSSSWSSAASTRSFASLPGTPRMRAKSLRWSAQESLSQSVLPCATTPSASVARWKSVKVDLPSTKASPAVGTVARMTMSIVVLLPAPLAPSRPKHSPLPTRKEQSWTATVSAALEPLGG
mmetsp:Transcript_21767/g.65245  ORF Transcript_21767/g.65245 Transcript_21767/m.65245 type:complete len:212 (-) Transcript_21767:331-966(-)